MKKRRVERVERRRRLAEPNLIMETNSRPGKATKGVIAAVRRALKGQR